MSDTNAHNLKAEEAYTPPHFPTENSGVCGMCFEPWPCPVAVTWEQAHAVFCPHGGNGNPDHDVCSMHLRPGDRYYHAHMFQRPSENPTPPGADSGGASV